MAALFGRICVSFLLLACLCFSPQSGFKEDVSSSYPRVLDPQTFTQDQDSVAQNHGAEDERHQSLVPQANNEPDESPPQPRHQHQDSGFHHPFNLLVQEHTKDTAVDGITFPDIGNLNQFIETLKTSFLIPGKDVSHFQTARGVMLNEIAGGRSSKEDYDDDDDNKVWNERLNSVYEQSEKDMGYPASSQSVSMPGPNTSMGRLIPSMHNSSKNHGRSGQSAYQTGPSNVKTGGDWWKNNQLPEKTTFPTNSFHGEKAPLSPRGTNPLHVHRVASAMANGSSIKKLKKSQIQRKMAPSQQGSYAKSVYMKAPRSPIASWIYMSDGRSKQRVQNTTAKDSYVNISTRPQKPADQSAHSARGLSQHHLLREPVNSHIVFFKPPLKSRDSLLRHHLPMLNIHKPRPSEQILVSQNQQSQGRHEHIPNTISQRLDSVQHRVASRNYAKPNVNASWLRATQPKIPQTNGIYRLLSPQRSTNTFHQAFPVYRGPKGPMSHGMKFGFQSRSSYVRSNVAFSRSQYTPRKRVFTSVHQRSSGDINAAPLLHTRHKKLQTKDVT
ncbi:uncharacterized protein LOC133477778 [Phyllopteryx taeniolatus]|uniref:uncharacterized protein LOC133477778 n=1 Tax=Phyllopteryx taeniolatus TaxID=161469 RepID=UPI002AD213AE|nr:uncharacterized protein LOC133477778 [Phyllopteryx taeniolatus]XP_061628901.1 uncharacterized protein LOC133477778 [Phyllopteryx taeniolatus]